MKPRNQWLSALCLALAAATAAGAAHAVTEFVHTGTVRQIAIINRGTNNARDWIKLNGLNPATHACPKDVDGYIILKLPHESTQANSHKAMLSVLQGAMLAARNVEVTFHDTLTDGSCTIKWIIAQ